MNLNVDQLDVMDDLDGDNEGIRDYAETPTPPEYKDEIDKLSEGALEREIMMDQIRMVEVDKMEEYRSRTTPGAFADSNWEILARINCVSSVKSSNLDNISVSVSPSALNLSDPGKNDRPLGRDTTADVHSPQRQRIVLIALARASVRSERAGVSLLREGS